MAAKLVPRAEEAPKPVTDTVNAPVLPAKQQETQKPSFLGNMAGSSGLYSTPRHQEGMENAKEVQSFMANATPGAGQILGAVDAYNGEDSITNKPLSWWQRALAVFGILSAGAAASGPGKKAIGKVLGAADDSAEAGNVAKTASKNAKKAIGVADEVAEAGSTLKKLASPLDKIGRPPHSLNGSQSLSSISKKLDTQNVNPYKLDFKVENGTIRIGDKPANGVVDFVITEKGEIRMGSGHFFLSDSADSVKAAGQLNLKDGKIDVVTNWSGHYQPTVDDLKAVAAALKNNDLFGPDAIVSTRPIPDTTLITRQ